ncbi:hypothetical protein E8E13_001037 [Curvularia kusanoi]|uniref:Heterokaryon incompatibility domain-containing protein n=1 Tax=Curvularia kusanoi TaxID=90978 RepID=A0A9P4T3T2_CURKU|nr:hypothetical protein E8E13_001037 [Curvularia kusanoi]
MPEKESHGQRHHQGQHLPANAEAHQRQPHQQPESSQGRSTPLPRDNHSKDKASVHNHSSNKAAGNIDRERGNAGANSTVSKAHQQPSPPRITVDEPKVDSNHKRPSSAPVSGPILRDGATGMAGGNRQHASTLLAVKGDAPDVKLGHARRASDPSGSDLPPSRSSHHAVNSGRHVYDTLGRRQFRLVKVLSASTPNLRCEIVTTSLDHPPPYTAISYAWGDPDEKTIIELEQNIISGNNIATRQIVSVSVTVSLYGALSALRQRTEDVYVWADLLSINQQNKDELSAQVREMSYIYRKAAKVAIWLGPEYSDSKKAICLIKDLADLAKSQGSVPSMIRNDDKRKDFPALVSLFERPYWSRLWIVQEVFLPDPSKITVYCGESKIPWNACTAASRALTKDKKHIEERYPANQDHSRDLRTSLQRFSFAQVLAHHGPASLFDSTLRGSNNQSLLTVMRVCRDKLAANPLDKVYGVRGLLSEDIQKKFSVDYKVSVKKLYIDVVEHILRTTQRVDILRESLHLPPHFGSATLPSWCPDWSYIPAIRSLQSRANFRASGSRENAIWKWQDSHQRRKLVIQAVHLDYIKVRGTTVGTWTTLADNLMAFLNWRALMLDTIKPKYSDRYQYLKMFSMALCLDQVLPAYRDRWPDVCHHVFASLLRQRLPGLLLDPELKRYADATGILPPEQRRQFLQDNFGTCMMGRAFCMTYRQDICMGSGFMCVNDLIVVPLGCDTPIILRQEGVDEYRYIGDIYVSGYMHGEAMKQLDDGQRYQRGFVLH